MAEPSGSSPVDALLGARPRSRASRWITIGLLLIALVVALTLLLRFVEGNDTPYYMVPVVRGDLEPRVSLPGRLQPAGEITVSAPRDARITALPGAVGSTVSRGQALAVVDTTEIAQAIGVDRSMLAATRAQIARAWLIRRDALRRLARFERVWRASRQRVPSLDEMEQARENAARAGIDLRRADALADAARQRLDADLEHLDAMLPRAPIDGVVTEQLVAPGTWVHAGEPIVRLAPPGAGSLVTVALDPSLGALPADTSVRVAIAGAHAGVFSAMLLRIDTGSSGHRRAVFALPPAPGIPLRAAANVELTLPERHHVLLVPNAALAFAPQCSTQLGPASVCLLGRDGAARSVPIVAGPSDGRRTQILAGAVRPGALAIIGWRDAPPASPAASQASAGPPQASPTSSKPS